MQSIPTLITTLLHPGRAAAWAHYRDAEFQCQHRTTQPRVGKQEFLKSVLPPEKLRLELYPQWDGTTPGNQSRATGTSMETGREQNPQKHKLTFFKPHSKVKNNILHFYFHKESVISRSCFYNKLLVFVVSFNACSCFPFCKTFPLSID